MKRTTFHFTLICLAFLAIWQSCNGQFSQSNSDDLIPYRKGNLYGYANRNLEMVIPPKYMQANLFNEYGLAMVSVMGPSSSLMKTGYINKKGEEVIEVGKYSIVGTFSEGLAWVAAQKDFRFKYGVVDVNGKEIVPPQYDEQIVFQDGLAKVKATPPPPDNFPIPKMGFIDKTGAIAIPIDYPLVSDFENGIAVAYKKGFGIINKKGEELAPFVFEEIKLKNDNPLAAETAPLEMIPAKFRENPLEKGKWGFIDRYGNMEIPFEFDHVSHFSDGLAFVQSNNKWGAIDKNGKIIIPLEYGALDGPASNLFLAKRGSQYGYINLKNEVIIPFQFDMAFRFENGVAIVGMNKAGPNTGRYWGIIDTEGKEITKIKYDNIKAFREGLASVELNQKYGFINEQGKEVIPLAYDGSVEFIMNGYAIVKGESGNFGVVDKANKTIFECKYMIIAPVQELKDLFMIMQLAGSRIAQDYIDINGNQFFED